MTVVDPGPRPELTWLPVKMLTVDPTYQRTLDGRRSKLSIEKIAANFRWSCFGAALVTESQDCWKIIDGQHRVEAARLVGMSTVPCIVVPPISVEEQARIFLSTNTVRVAINHQGLYRARVAAAEPRALACAAMCAELGIRILSSHRIVAKMKPGETTAVMALEEIACNPADRAGRLAVETIANAFRDKGGALISPLIHAVAAFLRLHPEEADKLQAWLARQHPGALRARYFTRDPEHDFLADLRRDLLADRQAGTSRAPAAHTNPIPAARPQTVPVPKRALPPSDFIKPLSREQLMRGRA
jgi:hypothetical protein